MYFAEHAGAQINPCVEKEIVLRWWSLRTDKQHVYMSFMRPLITTIHNVNYECEYSAWFDDRYRGLIMETLDMGLSTTSHIICNTVHVYVVYGRVVYGVYMIALCLGSNRNFGSVRQKFCRIF